MWKHLLILISFLGWSTSVLATPPTDDMTTTWPSPSVVDLSVTPISCPNHQLMVGFSSTHTGCVLYELFANGQTIAGIRDLAGNRLIELPFLSLQYKGN